MLYYKKESATGFISPEEISEAVSIAVDQASEARKIIIVPPDITRIHSGAGMITSRLWKRFGNRITDILPALGTHRKMSEPEISKMFKGVPAGLFREHDWRNDIDTLGEVPAEYLKMISEGKIDYPWPLQVNKLLNRSTDKLIVSIGQVVPHEVIGMANHNKNIFIGCGGPEGINKSHYLGAIYGMERIMGKANSPVRELLNFGESAFATHMNILYVLTVIATEPDGTKGIKGLFIGDDDECFLLASELSVKENFTILSKPLDNVVVYLDPSEFKSTWLGNKAIYRTRMAMADNGELTIIAPGVESFGEDPTIDKLIRKYGYRPSEEILELVNNNNDLGENLGVAAHLIHGSPENRFKVNYSTNIIPGEYINKAGYNWLSPQDAKSRYDISKLKDGYNNLHGGEEIFFISNPALGLWKTG